MTLYREMSNGFIVWSGERIDGVLYPTMIEQQWPAQELAKIGLYTPQPADEVPAGKIATETRVQRVGGVVKFVHTIADGPAPTVDEVAAERQRRLADGFDYDFEDSRGVHRIGTTDVDIRLWLDEVTPISQAFINAGQPDGVIGILTDTGPINVSATEWQDILMAAGEWRQPIYQASFALQAMSPIPADYADDKYWPV